MATTTYTYLDEIRTVIDKYTQQLSDEDIKKIALKYITHADADYTFTKVTDGYFRYISEKHLFLVNPTFTAEGGVNYKMYCGGVLEVSSYFESPSANDSRSSITVTGARIRMYAAIAEVLKMLAVRLVEAGNVSYANASISTATARQELMAQASHYAQMDECYGL